MRSQLNHLSLSKASTCVATVFIALAFIGGAHAASPAALLSGYKVESGVAPDSIRGKAFFTGTHGRDWSCASCHGLQPTQTGKHASTGKPIGPLAPAFNAERFTDKSKVEKWFRRNCNDVVGRECTASEKAAVLSWLGTLKP